MFDRVAIANEDHGLVAQGAENVRKALKII